MKKYDYIVIGSGPAGYSSAVIAAQSGLKTAVVEKDPNMLGGVCLNEGCIPAKSLYNSAGTLDIIKKNSDIRDLLPERISDHIGPFVRTSMERSERLRQGISFLFKKNGIDLIAAKAEFSGDNRLRVIDSLGETDDLEAGNILIASGASPRKIKELPFDGKKVLSSTHAIRLDKIPGRMLIIGGGAIGAEFASFFNIMGAEVTIVEKEPYILPAEDRDVSKRLKSVFEKEGIKVMTSTGVSDLDTREFDAVIVAVGRVPSTGGIGLDKCGLETDEKGFIPVDRFMRTRVQGIYAAGDVVNSPMLAHMASAEGELAARAVADKNPEKIDYSSVPNAVYTRVQVSSVGLTETQASEKSLDFSVGKQFFKSNGKAVVCGEDEGFIKIIADNRTRCIIGVHILGTYATELIHEFALAKRKGLKVDDISATVHAHPTFSESAVDAARAVFGKPIHG